jgi:hypothetical protein
MSGQDLTGLPVFAVVGRVNMGKSAVLATLLEVDDNEVIRVSPTPGETTCCQVHRLVFGEREWVRLIDTPGFSRPVEAMREIQRLHGVGVPGVPALRRFVAAGGADFADERRLLEPLLEGAGVLYVVDPAKPLRDDFLAEMEILRWTGQPRLALLNRRSGATGAEEEHWRSRLGGAFNLVRTFDAHWARFDDRVRLLRALLEIDERHHERLVETIRLVEDEWRRRREDAVELIVGFLETALGLRVSVPVAERELALPKRRGRHTEALEKRYFSELAELEQRCYRDLLAVYRHHLLVPEANAEAFVGIDLQCAETWRKWGLSRAQLAAVGAMAGGASGLAVDAATGGLTHGAGTVVGVLGGAAGAWLKGGSLPDLRLDFRGGRKLGTGETRTLMMGPPKNPNFPWVLLNGVLSRFQRMVTRSHGRRNLEVLTGGLDGLASDLSMARRSVLGKWFASCLKGTPNRGLEPEVFEILVEVLEEVEQIEPR